MKKVLIDFAIVFTTYIIFKFSTYDTFFWGWIGGSLALALTYFKDNIVKTYSAEKETEKE